MEAEEIRRRIETGHRRQPPQDTAAATAPNTGATHGANIDPGLAAAGPSTWWPGVGTQHTQIPSSTYQHMMGSQPAPTGLLAGPQANTQVPAGTHGFFGPPWTPGHGPHGTWMDAPSQGYTSVSIIPIS